MNSKNDQLINEYKDRRPVFGEFNIAVFKLLQNILEEGNYKYQITYRTKTLGSLREKLAKKEMKGRIYKNLEDIKDLAGVRIVFYFESDEKKFIKEMINEISGQLIVEKKNKPSGYSARHVILSFGPKRLILNEYKKFKKLKCEVQLTSILYHAWSEIEHDLIYKNINRQKKEYQNIKGHLDKVFNHYIKKAVAEIDKIAKLLKQNKNIT
jgi:ppGpp synthetase/RelA/SpoT-type nucleotidyltranferase